MYHNTAPVFDTGLNHVDLEICFPSTQFCVCFRLANPNTLCQMCLPAFPGFSDQTVADFGISCSAPVNQLANPNFQTSRLGQMSPIVSDFLTDSEAVEGPS